MNQLYIITRSKWRKWLSDNHSKSKGVWLIFYKKETGKPTLDYETAVEEALCYGWIDSIVKKIDKDRYVRKLTPRSNYSVWSELNKKRVKKVIKEGTMTEFGLKKINAAKKAGMWNKKVTAPQISYEVPGEFLFALKKTKMQDHILKN
jgi:uncharacterized protein YdeI (YjbR/CyaY-like superfamily)